MKITDLKIVEVWVAKGSDSDGPCEFLTTLDVYTDRDKAWERVRKWPGGGDVIERRAIQLDDGEVLLLDEYQPQPRPLDPPAETTI